MTQQHEPMQRLLCRTAEAIAEQPALPPSPGVMVDGQPMLCAGAAVVYHAAAPSWSPEALYRLASDMIGAGKEAILRKAEDLQLDTKLVELIVLNNDACADQDRRPRMDRYLTELAHGPGRLDEYSARAVAQKY